MYLNDQGRNYKGEIKMSTNKKTKEKGKNYICEVGDCRRSFNRLQDVKIHVTRKHPEINKAFVTDHVGLNDVKLNKVELNKVVGKFQLTSSSRDEKITFASGASSSGKLPRFDLIPRIALQKLAERFTLGSIKYGDFNYKKGFNDKKFILDRINHLRNHCDALISPKNAEEWDDDNIAAILWGGAFLAELSLYTAGREILQKIRAERATYDAK